MTSRSSNNRLKPFVRAGALAVALVALGACTAGGSARDNPVLRKFQWFSYLEGGDFKETCGPGARSLYRMVYNGIYEEQVRIYEFDPQARTLAARVISRANLRDVSISSPNDLLNPWRGVEAVTRMGDSDSAALVRDLAASGAFGPPNVGAELSSRGFFWTVASCHDGQYHFTGFTWPSAAWQQARFAGRLFVLDETGVAVNDPRRTKTGRDLTHSPNSGQRPYVEYHLKVGENGLADFATLF